MDVTFSSNKNRANYDCILLDNTTQTPAVESCKQGGGGGGGNLSV